MNNNTALQIFYKMMKTRLLEEIAVKLKDRGLIADKLRLSLGQEGTAAAVCALSVNDAIYVSQRNTTVLVSANVPCADILAELMGLPTGICGGKGSLSCAGYGESNIFPASPRHGVSFMKACGTTLSFRMQSLKNAVICFAGDGAAGLGEFYEAINFASLNNLPMVFFIENNAYAGRMPFERVSNVKEISLRAKGFDIPGFTVDGNDPAAVYELTDYALAYAKENRGPVLIESRTYRLAGTTYEEVQNYRDEKEVIGRAKNDPIENHTQYMLKNKIGTLDDFLSMREMIQKEIDEDVDGALTSVSAKVTLEA